MFVDGQLSFKIRRTKNSELMRQSLMSLSKKVEMKGGENSPAAGIIDTPSTASLSKKSSHLGMSNQVFNYGGKESQIMRMQSSRAELGVSASSKVLQPLLVDGKKTQPVSRMSDPFQYDTDCILINNRHRDRENDVLIKFKDEQEFMTNLTGQQGALAALYTPGASIASQDNRSRLEIDISIDIMSRLFAEQRQQNNENGT